MRDVTAVEPVPDYGLVLTFDNGERRRLDLRSLLSFQSVFAPLQDPNYFRRVAANADLGTIVWPNGADLCPDVLYERSQPLISVHDSP